MTLKNRKVRGKEKRRVVALSDIDLNEFDTIFKKIYSDVKKEIIKVNWLTGHKPSYLETYRRYVGMFDRFGYQKFIDYFIKNHNLRQSTYSYRNIISESYFKKEKQNTGVFNIKLPVNSCKKSDLVELTDEAIYAISDIREIYIKDLYAFIKEYTGCNKDYSIPDKKLSY